MILQSNGDASCVSWRPTTLTKIGRSEAFLENAIAQDIELLGIQTLRSHIYGPYAVFSQSSLPTPTGRGIRPDLLALSESGHVIAIEVKLSTNGELRDRAVIAQIIDYASSLSALDERGAMNLFGSGADGATTWAEVVQHRFPNSDDPQELADTLMDRMRRGELNLVIACDRAPLGLAGAVEAIASQSALGFDLDLVEIVPYVRGAEETGDILLVPVTRVATQIVARTAVTVIYREGHPKPETSVATTSLEEIEANVHKVERGVATGRVWSKEEVIQDFEENGNDVERALLAFTAAHGAGGIGVSSALKANATFGFYVDGALSDGRTAKWMLFYCARGWQYVELKLNVVEQLAGEAVHRSFVSELSRLFGDGVALHQKVPRIPLGLLRSKLPEFEQAILQVAEKIASRRRERESNVD